VDTTDIGWGAFPGLLKLARADLRPLPYITRYAQEAFGATPTDLVRHPCLTDPAYREEESRKTDQIARWADRRIPMGEKAVDKFGDFWYTLTQQGVPYRVAWEKGDLKGRFRLAAGSGGPEEGCWRLEVASGPLCFWANRGAPVGIGERFPLDTFLPPTVRARCPARLRDSGLFL